MTTVLAFLWISSLTSIQKEHSHLGAGTHTCPKEHWLRWSTWEPLEEDSGLLPDEPAVCRWMSLKALIGSRENCSLQFEAVAQTAFLVVGPWTFLLTLTPHGKPRTSFCTALVLGSMRSSQLWVRMAGTNAYRFLCSQLLFHRLHRPTFPENHSLWLPRLILEAKKTGYWLFLCRTIPITFECLWLTRRRVMYNGVQQKKITKINISRYYLIINECITIHLITRHLEYFQF